MDISREYYELGLPVIEKAGVAHKIDFREGPALPLLDQLIKDVSSINPCTLFSRKRKNQCQNYVYISLWCLMMSVYCIA